jgi:pimeloyl-ACP methyl ester carboxylesterase
MQVSLGDGSLNVVDQGSGQVVVLVHGFPLDHSMWREQIDALAAHYRVIAPDLRGFGQSEPVEGTLTMAAMAADLLKMLDALEISGPVVVCGLSMGGYVAMQFWKQYENRLRGLVLCDTRAMGDTPEAATNRLAMAEKVMKEGSQVVAEAMLPKLFAPECEKSQPEIVQQTKEVILKTAPATIAAAQRGMAERPDMRSTLTIMKLPTLVVCGEQDVISPLEEMKFMAEALPQGRFEVIKDAGHMSPLEKPQAFNTVLLNWLEKLDASEE